jgi:hypothetical protein
VETCSSASSIHRFYFFKDAKILILGGISKFRLADLGIFWQFWAEFATLIVAESLPKANLKSSKSHNS